jgi:phosphatidylserine/phosphatidylglycerophosphate/cardiolipin synthase-like enzyme
MPYRVRAVALAALTWFATSGVTAEPEVPAVRVFFGPRSADDPDGLHLNLLRFLDSAKTSLVGAVHEIDMITVADKLAARARAGVTVELVVEADWWLNAKNTAARQVLQKAGIKVHPDSKKSGLMHDKFFVADGERVWTGSTNMTETCLLYNPNSSLWLESKSLAAHFRREFDDMAAGKFGKRKAVKVGEATATAALADGTVRVWFSPQDEPLQPIVDRIDSARERVDVMCFVFSSREVAEALLRAQKRGVKVRVLLDNIFSAEGSIRRWPYVPFRELRKAGIPVKFDDEDAKLHHKVVIVDGKTVGVGSFNLSASAATTNDENLLIIDAPSVAKRYATEFERLWAYYHGDPGEPPPPERGDRD